MPVEETIHEIHEDERRARNACAALNRAAEDDQTELDGEVHDSQTWTVTSMLVEQEADTAPGRSNTG